MASPLLLPAAALFAALVSASCIFGGDDDSPDESATETPVATNETPTAGQDDEDTEAANGDDGEAPGDASNGEDEPGTYTVQEGDMLSLIAEELGVSLDELIEANDIQDPNVIEVGQELVIPGQGAEGASDDGE